MSSEFSFFRDFSTIKWGATLQLNAMRGFAAGVVWTLIFFFFILKPENPTFETILYYIAAPFVLAIVYIPFGLIIFAIGSLLERFGCCLAALLLGGLGLTIIFGDPFIYILHRVKPNWVPVERYGLLNPLIIFVTEDNNSNLGGTWWR